MNGQPKEMRGGKQRFRFAALLLGAGWIVGCAKVEEMAKTATETAKEKVASATSKPADAPAQAVPQASSSAPAAATAKVDSKKVLEEFLALPRNDIRDEHLIRLASMDEAHREQVLKLDLKGTSLSAAGISALASFPNLAEVNLDETQLAPADLASVDQLTSLRSLSLGSSSGVNGATLTRLTRLPGLERLVLTGAPIADEDVKTIAQIKSLKYLNLSQTPVSGASLAALSGLSDLQGLHLNANQNLGEQGLLEITKLEKLLDLDISACGMADKHFSILRAWPNLRSLRCNNNSLTDEGMVFLKPLNDLVELDLRNTRVTDKGFALVSSRKLERLWCPGLSDQGMTLIKRFPTLRELYLANTGVGDQGIVQLKGLRNLNVLDLSSTSVSDRGLAELVGLKGLRRLYVGKSGVTDVGVAGIKNAIPDLEVLDSTTQ